jgi:hypothetical protein
MSPSGHTSNTHILSLKYNQQDATFSRSVYLYKLLYMFQAVSPPIIRSTKLYIQRQVLSNHYCCLLLLWMSWLYFRDELAMHGHMNVKTHILVLCHAQMQRATWTTTRKTINYERRLSIFERKILRRLCGPICKGEQWRMRYGRELEELYNEPNIVKVIKSSRLRWAGHVVRMDDNELPKNILWKNHFLLFTIIIININILMFIYSSTCFRRCPAHHQELNDCSGSL